MQEGICKLEDLNSACTRIWTRDFVLVCLANMLVFLSFYSLMPTIPRYVQYLGASESIVGLITGIFTVSALSLRPWLGRELDRRGFRRIYLFGLLIYSIIAVSYIWAPTVLALFLLRSVHGFGWSAASTAASTIATGMIPAQRRGEGMGYFGMFGNLAMAVAPGAAITLLKLTSYQVVFGAASILAGLALLSGAGIQSKQQKNASPRNSLFELSALHPVVVAFFMMLSFSGIVTFLPLYAAHRGISQIGLFYTVYSFFLVATRPLAGMGSDRFGYNVIILPGLLLIASSSLILSVAGEFRHYLLAAAVYGTGIGACQPTLQALTVSKVSPGRFGTANAMFLMAWDLGIGLGAVIMGAISQLWGYPVMYRVAALFVVTGALVYFAGRPRYRAISGRHHS
ncbi:hypothetical protein SY88_15560 [Clostridiales bacterium PH28_bin88]|nr:hypothetical protein SY88_15560 [Clostridiales bacterium PH28_bin88]